MGFDPELLRQLIETFRIELDEQLEVITKGLLILERSQPEAQQAETIKSIFRAAHNIKGAARSLEIDHVGEIAHKIESLFAAIQENQSLITHELIDICLDAVDKMQLAMQSFYEKKSLPFDIESFLTKLSFVPMEEAVPSSITHKEMAVETQPTENIELPEEKVEFKTHDSIRIPLRHIEHVSALMEEMQVNKIGIDDHYLEVNRMNHKLKEFAKHWQQMTLFLKNHFVTHPMSDLQDNYFAAIDLFAEIQNSSNTLRKNMRTRVNELSTLTDALQDEIRLMRLVPAAQLFGNMPRYVRDLSRELNKDVDLKIIGDEVKLDKSILEYLKDPIMHILRNNIDHGIEEVTKRVAKGKPATGHIVIHIKEESGMIAIEISDDGRGIDLEKVKQIALKKNLVSQAELEEMTDIEATELIFQPGFSTKEIITDVSGRGVGLDVVKTNLANINGTVSVNSVPNQGTRFKLLVPLTLSSERGLLVAAACQSYVIPTTSVQRVLTTHVDEIIEVEGMQAITLDNHSIPIHSLVDILNLEQKELPLFDRIAVVVVKRGRESIALAVDEIIGEREIVIKPLHPPLSNVPCVAGGTLSGTNQVIIVLDPKDVIQFTNRLSNRHAILQEKMPQKQTDRPHILVADDSITTRTLEKNILESRHYNVTVAVNGKEAWDLLQKHTFSLLITDVTMPIMDGFTLTERVKKSNKLKSMPVIIVTSLGSEAEKRRGIEAGANAYLIKNEFESSALLNIVAQLV